MTIESELLNLESSTELCLSQLKEALSYDPETGLFHRQIASNNRLTGDIAVSERADGYLAVCVYSKRYLAHRLAWFYVYGKWPNGHLDHINQLKYDNRIINLRIASQAQNNINQGAQINNMLGVKGVKRHGNKFVARISHKGIQHYLGLFDTLGEAIDARKAAEIEFYGEFAER